MKHTIQKKLGSSMISVFIFISLFTPLISAQAPPSQKAPVDNFNAFATAANSHFNDKYFMSGADYSIGYDRKEAPWLDENVPDARLIQAYARFRLPHITETFIDFDGTTYVMPDDFNQFVCDAHVQLLDEDDVLGLVEVYVKAWEPSGSAGIPAAVILQSASDIPHLVRPVSHDVAQQIKRPVITRQDTGFLVDLYSWCEVGGWVREWHITISSEGMITAENTVIEAYVGDCIIEGAVRDRTSPTYRGYLRSQAVQSPGEHTKNVTIDGVTRFVIHWRDEDFNAYSDGNATTVVNWVENAAITSWAYAIVDWNFSSPPDDVIDVYIWNNTEPWGPCATSMEPNMGPCYYCLWTHQYIYINNNLLTWLVARNWGYPPSIQDIYTDLFLHEFFHSIQEGYKVLGTGYRYTDTDWIVEGTARFAQTVIMPNAEFWQNSYLEGVWGGPYNQSAAAASMYIYDASRYLTRPDLSLYFTDYSACIYWRYLYENFGGMDNIRRLFERINETDPGDNFDNHIAAINDVYGVDDLRFYEFARANYYAFSENAFARQDICYQHSNCYYKNVTSAKGDLDCTTNFPLEVCNANFPDYSALYREYSSEINFTDVKCSFDGADDSRFGATIVHIRGSEFDASITLLDEHQNVEVVLPKLNKSEKLAAIMTRISTTGGDDARMEFDAESEDFDFYSTPTNQSIRSGETAVYVITFRYISPCNNYTLLLTNSTPPEGWDAGIFPDNLTINSTKTDYLAKFLVSSPPNASVGEEAIVEVTATSYNKSEQIEVSLRTITRVVNDSDDFICFACLDNSTCDDHNFCTEDICEDGCCIHTMLDICTPTRPITTPGGDHPDETYDVSMKDSESPTCLNCYNPGYSSNEVNASIGILSNGFAADFSKLLSEFGESGTLVSIGNLGEMDKYSVFVIPTGGFYGLSSLQSFKTKLEEYVNHGGTLIVLAQQHGYEFDTAPGDISGYGWLEDQSCQHASTGISTYHVLLAGQDSVTLDANVDGYFTRYPDNATVLLSRTKNAMPAMVLYKYGNGTVIASTMYEDWAHANHQATKDGKNLTRDMIAWAKGTGEIPDYAPGDAIAIPISVVNHADITAHNVSFRVRDPDKNVVGYVNVTNVSIVPNETEIINFSYTAPSKLGIWWIDYLLYNDELIQTTYEAQRFAVSKYAENPDGFAYQGATISFGVNSEREKYPYGTNATFTITIWNHGDEDKTVTCWWNFPHSYGATRNPIYGCSSIHPGHRSSLYNTVTIPAHGEASFVYTVPIVHVYEDRLWADFYEGDASSFNYLGKASRGFYTFIPQISVWTETDRKTYVSGANVSVSLNLTNGNYLYDYNSSVTVRTIDSVGTTIYEQSFNVSLNASSFETETITFTLPSNPVYGTYRVTAEAFLDSVKIGSGSALFNVVRPYSAQLSLDRPDRVYAIRQNMTVSINVTLVGQSSLPLGTMLNLSIPALNITKSWTVEIEPNTTESVSYEVYIPETITVGGTYDINVTVSYDNATLRYWFIIPESQLHHILEKSDYAAGETLNITLENTGGVDTTFNYSAQLQDTYLSTILTDTLSGTLGAGATTRCNLTLPGGLRQGDYFLWLTYEDIRTNETRTSLELLSVSGVDAAITSRTDKQVYSSGENITVLTNVTTLNGEISGARLNLKILGGSPPAPPQQCVTPTDNLYINSNCTLCPGVYNITDSSPNGVIIINASGIVVEGLDTVLVGNGSGNGIYNPGFDNVTIRGISVRNYSTGISLTQADNNCLINNTASNNSNRGIYLYYPDNITLTNNNANNNKHDGIYLSNSKNCIITNNTANGNSAGVGSYSGIEIRYVSSATITNNTANGNGLYGFYLYASSNNAIIDNTASHNRDGIYLEYSSNYNTLTGNTANSNDLRGIYLYNSHYNTLTGNTASSNDDYGIVLEYSNNNNLTGNTASHNSYYGIDLGYSSYTTLTDNTASHNSGPGIYLYSSSYNNLTGNTISNNSNDGIYLYAASNNNNLAGNTISNNSGSGIYLYSSSNNNNLTGNIALNNNNGIYLYNSYYNNLTDNTVSNNTNYGIHLRSSNNTLTGNTASNNNVGIYLPDSGSKYNNLTGNTASNNKYGIYLYASSKYNNLTGNTANSNNKYGIYLYSSSNNTLTNNTASSNTERGISLESSSVDNVLLENVFCSNSNYDISNSSSRNVGINNTCNSTNNWSDEGTTGCTYDCAGISSPLSSFAPSELFSTGDRDLNRPPEPNFTPDVTENETGLVPSSPRALVPDTDGLEYSASPSVDRSWQRGEGADNDGERDEIDQGTPPATMPPASPPAAPQPAPLGSIVSLVHLRASGLLSALGEGFTEGFTRWSSQFVVPASAAVTSSTSNESYTLWEQNLTLDVTNLTDIVTAVGNLNVTGKLYLYATLYSSTGQIVAYNLSTFYITDEDLFLTLETDKRVYKPHETVTIQGTVTNQGGSAESCNLTITQDDAPIYAETFILDPGVSHPFVTNTSSNASFSLEGAVGNVKVADFIMVESPCINVSMIAPDVVGVGPITVGVLIENTGNISADLNVSLNNTWNITIPEGESRLLETTITITQNTTLNLTISGDVDQYIQKELICGEKVTVNISPQPIYLDGPVEIPYILENLGLLDSEFNATFSISSADQQTIIKQIFIPEGEILSDTVSFNLSKGEHVLHYSSPFETVSVAINVLSPPKIVVTSIDPAELNFTMGQNVIMTFVIENRGGTEGAATLTLQMPDFEDTNMTWIKPGDVANLSFRFTIPDDLQEKSYKGVYELNGEKQEFTFFVHGANISVNASLDKRVYQEGETAVLTMDVTNNRAMNLSLYSRVKFNEYENVTYFNLTELDTETLVFNIPVNFTGDVKQLYTVYMDTGRALYINALYVHEQNATAPLTLYTDKDVYAMGETVTIHIENVSAPGVLNLTAPNFTYYDTINGSTTVPFTMPETQSGTYYVRYTFETYTGVYPFDVVGYSARILEASLDKERYHNGDTVLLNMTIEANRAASGLLRTKMYGPASNVIDKFEANMTLIAGENAVQVNRTLTTNDTGIHRITYTFYADMIGQGLVSGLEYFDAWSPGLLITEPVNRTYASTSIRLWFTIQPEDTIVNWLGYSLDGGANVTIPGNTTISSLSSGEHTIVVYAQGSDGTIVKSTTIHFTIHAGDITSDKTVNIFDLQQMAWAFMSHQGDQNWNENADLNCDGVVNIFDLQILAWNFMNHY